MASTEAQSVHDRILWQAHFVGAQVQRQAALGEDVRERLDQLRRQQLLQARIRQIAGEVVATLSFCITACISSGNYLPHNQSLLFTILDMLLLYMQR